MRSTDGSRIAQQLGRRLSTTQFGQAVEQLSTTMRDTITNAPIRKATGIVKDYAVELYYPVGSVSLGQRVRITPLLMAAEYLMYRVDAVAERNIAADLNEEKVQDYGKLRTYKRVFARALRAMGAWNEEVARQVDEGERFVRLENAATARGNVTHQDVMAAAELRPTDVRVLHAMTYALRGREMDTDVRDLLRPVEVLADIANDVKHYERDVAAGTFNVYAAFVDLYGDRAPDLLRREVDRYETLFEERLETVPALRRDQVGQVCRRRFAAAKAAYPDPIERPATGPQPKKKDPVISRSVFITGTLCAIAWIVAYAGIIKRGFDDAACGIPIAALSANLSWEFIYGFVLDPFGDYIHNASIVWFLVDLVIVWQAWKYGAADFKSPFVRKNFRKLFAGGVGAAMPITYYSFIEFNDPDGEYTGFGINLIMSILFVAMLERRDSVAGQSMYVAISKWIGTFLAWAATALTVTTSPQQQLPTSFRAFVSESFRHREYPLTPLINVTYWTTFIVDGVYTGLLYKKLRAAGVSPWRF